LTREPWALNWSGPAVRQLSRLPESVAAAIIETVDAIKENPRRVGKPLRWELEERWVARRGQYRVMYRFDESQRRIEVLSVGHRSDIYRRR